MSLRTVVRAWGRMRSIAGRIRAARSAGAGSCFVAADIRFRTEGRRANARASTIGRNVKIRKRVSVERVAGQGVAAN